MQVTFYSLSKRKNSTKRPTASGNTQTVVLKDNCSILSPSLEINWGNNDPSAYNYCYIPMWGRYYYITDWTFDGRNWIMSAVSDAMASFRGDIHNSTLYVLRSQSDYNLHIMDSTYPAETEEKHLYHYYNTNWAVSSLTGGCFIVGVVGWNSMLATGIMYYVLNGSDFADLRNFIFSNTPEYKDTGNPMSWGDLSALDYFESKITNIMNMFQYIVSVMWFPFFPPTSEHSDIHIAYWNSGINANYLTTSHYYAEFDILIPKHPTSATRGDWLKMSPYSNYTLYTTTFGAISIPSNAIADNTNLHCEITCDMISGVGGLRISGDTDGFCGQYTGQIGVSQLLAGTKTAGIAGAVEGGAQIGTSLSSAFQGNSLSLSGIANGVESALSSLAPRALVSGSTGSGALFSSTWLLQLDYFDPVDENIAGRGRPLCERRQLGTLSGFCQVADGNITTEATPAEKQEIKTYLEGGFYLE